MKTLQSKTYFLFILLIGFAIIGCSSDDNKSSETTDPGTLTEKEEVQQVKVKLVAIIRDSGRDFPQFELSQPRTTNSSNDLDDFLNGPNNYMETINEPGGLKLRLWLDEEGSGSITSVDGSGTNIEYTPYQGELTVLNL